MNDQIAIPDFVVAGIYSSDADLYVLWATTSLTSAELKEETTYYTSRYHRIEAMEPGDTKVYLTAEFKEYVITTGKTYGEAWENLFKYWSEQQQNEIERKLAGITTKRKELDSGE